MNSDQTNTNTEMNNDNTQELPTETTDNQQLTGEGQKAEAKTGKRTHARSVPQKLTSIEDALNRPSVSRHLLSAKKLVAPASLDSPTFQLVKLVARELLNAYKDGSFTPEQDYSQFACLFANVNPALLNGDSVLESYVSKYVLEDETATVSLQMLKLVDTLLNLVNFNLLNYSVYVDKKVISALRVYNIIETVLFTQVLFDEATSNKLQFKQSLAEKISTLTSNILTANPKAFSRKSAEKKKASPPSVQTDEQQETSQEQPSN